MKSIYREQTESLSYISIGAIIFSAWLASGCGATQSDSSPAAFTSLSSYTATSGTNAICNQMSTTGTRMNASLRAVDGNLNDVRVRITGLTSQFDGNPNINLQFFRWQATTGAPTLDSTPLTFHIEGASTNGVSGNQLTSNMTGINITNVRSIASSNYLTVTSAEQFFNQVDIILHDVTGYQAVKFVLYNSGSIVASNDALMPPFLANPNSYDVSHASVLNSLHPFANMLSYTDAQYTSMAQSFCF